jgi:thiol-disulfide isomerase/thioredoxin
MGSSIKTFVLPSYLFLLVCFLPLFVQAQSKKTKIVDLNDAKYQGISFNELIKKYKGKVIYIDFWASWCTPCLKEMPQAKTLQNHFSDKDFEIAFISPERNADAWQNKIEELEIPGDHYLSNPELWKEIKKKLDLKSIPRYVLINEKGRIVNKNTKSPGHPETIKEIESML